MLKILQTKLQQCVKWRPPDVHDGFRKGRETRDQIVNICWIIKKKQENSRKTSSYALLTMPKPLTVCITINWGKFLEIGIVDHLTCILKKQQLELDMEEWTVTKLGKEYIKAVYCQPAYLTYVQSISCEMLGWMKHKLESRLPREMSITSDMQMIPSLQQKVKGN